MTTKAVSFMETAFLLGADMEQVLNSVNAVVWGIPALMLVLGVGLYLSFCTKFVQIRMLPAAIKKFLSSFKENNSKKEGISAYRALCTALAATVGTGNIAGVAGAIALGGPGVVFWMWLCGALGMVTKFAEVTLAVHYRVTNEDGKTTGGPMYMIKNGLPHKFHFLGYAYCFLGVVAAFGVGNATQINAVVNSAKDAAEAFQFDFGITASGILAVSIAVLVLICFWNDNGRVGTWTERLIPFASLLYILLSIGVLVIRFDRIGSAFREILIGALCPKAVTCGMIGSLFLSLRVGASRGVFTNEAGMGTASIAHASAETASPVEQGLMGIMEVFLDTMVLCTLTALVILCSDVQIPYGSDPGIILAMDAFSSVYGAWSRGVLSMLICLFAFATILGWGLYGIRCVQFLFGNRSWCLYSICQAGGILLGSVLNTSIVWSFSEIVNGLMAIPNLIVLLLLTPELKRIISDYTSKKKAYNYK